MERIHRDPERERKWNVDNINKVLCKSQDNVSTDHIWVKVNENVRTFRLKRLRGAKEMHILDPETVIPVVYVMPV